VILGRAYASGVAHARRSLEPPGVTESDGMREIGLRRTVFLVCYFAMLSTCFYLAFATITISGLEEAAKESVLYQATWISLYVWLCLEIVLTKYSALRVLKAVTVPMLLILISVYAYAVGGAHDDAIVRLIMFSTTIVFAAWLASVVKLEELCVLFYGVASVIAVIQLILYPFLKEYSVLFDQLERTTILGLSPYSGLFGHKNLAGGFFGLSILMRLVSSNRLSFVRQPVGIVLFAAQLICFLWSGAVTSVVALALAMLFVLCLKVLRRNRPLGIVGLCAAGAIILGAALFLDPILSLFGRDVGLSGRENIYSIWPQFFLERPLFGYGYGEFFSAAADAPSIALNRLTQWGGVVTFESGYLQCLIDFGALGGLVFAYIIARAMITSVKIAKTKSTYRDVPLAVMIFVLCGSVSANFIEAHNTVFPVLVFYFYSRPKVAVTGRDRNTLSATYALAQDREHALAG
jgi:exopolysaccharide production protein ExoQ